ncbi:hypothetical protein [Nocardioides pakistanensis]
MSKERARNRAAREHEAAVRTAAQGHEQDRTERPLSMKSSGEVLGKHGGASITQPQHHHKPRKPAGNGAKAGKGRPTPKQSGPRTPAAKKRPNAPVGRPDGPLARRRRFRVRLLVVLLLAVNVAVALVWRDWPVSLAVLIVSAVTAPLLAAALLRRK